MKSKKAKIEAACRQYLYRAEVLGISPEMQEAIDKAKEMEKPKRIQRKRTKGWKMPENTVYVGRPSKWGNPFKVKPEVGFKNPKTPLLISLWLYSIEIRSQIKLGLVDLTELKGKNLACWCKIGEPCHADILLKLANKE